ncbi:hypothetical protein H257_04884 [Aphanomyces astaci]|uniref:Uncharacterized protein n=1 Tax=Aphanomyces astaci TaxID=112090 RepID=W4GR54_APHAT|nr:hypothetical protein H257_04884 [Aphanomyces astaci]ETV82172.1 hypothetical protein H257_04884 [Aphanomyces astaci]|eukprot:XP_009827841.1 hypothetical protein H257_04884 [Aphanomyces astaci]
MHHSKEQLAECPSNSIAHLTMLVQHHHEAIPFENRAACLVFSVDPAHADTSIGERVSLHTAKIFKKLVLDRRGGWCFEQNALFTTRLRALGYAVETICGDVVTPAMEVAHGKYLDKAMTHMLLLVTTNTSDQFLWDVGFGGRGESPIPIPVPPSAHQPSTCQEDDVGLWGIL